MTLGDPVRTRGDREPIEGIRRQNLVLVRGSGVEQTLEDLPLAAVVVNAQRQIVFGNRAFAAFLDTDSLDQVLGRRFGEAVRCTHSDETPAGCGTTEFCTTCGANNALRAAAHGSSTSQECRIISKLPGQDLDLRVWARPLLVADERFTLVTVMDIRHEKRRAALERIFFHDVLNTAGGIQGIAMMLAEAAPAQCREQEEVLGALQQLSEQLVEELAAQRDLVAMEHGDLAVRPARFLSKDLLDAVVQSYRRHPVAAQRLAVVEGDSDNVPVFSDPRLVKRVLGNMVKNALEACPPGGTVTAACHAGAATIRFAVHNPSAMPRDVQLQLFQRSFSTKGPGRGIGTYSMRLLTEHYLSGRMSFSSDAATGTTFVAEFPRDPRDTAHDASTVAATV